jgi:hypothetical protein
LLPNQGGDASLQSFGVAQIGKLSVPAGLGLLLRPATCLSFVRLIAMGVSLIPKELLVVLASRVYPPLSPA